MKRATFIILSTLAALFPAGHAAEGENLLKNPDFEQDAKGIPGWEISQASMGDIAAFAETASWGTVKGPDGNCLTIATKEPTAANVWWQQDVKGIGGVTYEVRVEVKGALQPGSKYGMVRIGVYSLGANNQWLGFQAIPDPELSDAWTTVRGKITVPSDTVGMGLRLGIMCDGEMEVFFKNPSLTEVF